jgi:hypothetical protein
MLAIALPGSTWMTFASYEGKRTYRPPTAASVTYELRQEFPTGFLDFSQEVEPKHSNALDWISLGREVLPNATPLTAEERASVNEFFWAHFE